MSQSDFVSRGQALVSAGQYQEAVKVCRLGLLGRPTTVEGRVVLGQALLALKRYDEVLAEMRVALELDHASLAAQVLKGEALLKKGDPHAAIDILQRARLQAPDDQHVSGLLLQAKRSAGRPASTASHPAVGFVSEDTRHYPSHSADEEDTSDDDGATEGYTRPTSLSAPGAKKRTPAPAPADTTPPPAVLAVGDRSGTVEVDPEIDGVELPDDDFEDVAAPPRSGAARAPVANDAARGKVMPATRPGVGLTMEGRAPAPFAGAGRRAPLPAPLPVRPDRAARAKKGEVSTVELEDDDMLEAHETLLPNEPRRQAPGPGTAVRNAVGMPSGPLEPRPSTAASRPTAAAPAMVPPPQLAQMLPQPMSSQTIRGNPIAAALPTMAAQPQPPNPYAPAPMPVNPAAVRPTMAINAPQEPAWARSTAAAPNAAGNAAAMMAANEPTQRPQPLPMPAMAMPMPMPMPPQMLEGSTPAVAAMLEPSQSAAKSLKTGMRKSRSKLQIFVWFLIGGLVIGGGVFAGFQIRAMRLKKQIAAAREQAITLAKADTWKGWVGARDRLYDIARASATFDNRAALARTRALVAYEFGDGLPEAKSAYDSLGSQSSLDMELAGAYLALAQNDAKTARTAADNALALSPDDPAALYITGQAAMITGDLATAIKNLKTAVEREPRPLYAIALARAYLEASAYTDASAALDKAFAAQADHPGALIERAMLVAATAGSPARAIEQRALLQKVASEGNKTLDQQPRGVSPLQIGLAYLALMQLDFVRGDAAAVGADLDSALAVKLDEERFGEQIIESLFAVGNLDKAAGAAEAALRAWPNDRRVRVAYARVLLAQNKAADALAVLSKITDIKDSPVAMAVRGQANAATGEGDAARRDFEIALKKLPTLELAIVNRAWLDIDGGDVPAARKAVDPGKKAASQSTAMATVYAATLRLSGEREEAKKLLEKITSGAPNSDTPRAQLELARIYRDLGDKRAKAAYAEASRTGSFEAKLESGLLLVEWSDPQGGKDQLDSLLKATSQPSAALLLETARAHMLVGDHAGATDLLDQANKQLPQQLKWKYDRERGRLALRKGDLPGAAIVLASALDGCGDDAETFLLAADVAAADDKQPKLTEQIKSLAAKRLKGRPELQIVTGKLLASKGDEAGKAFESAQQTLDASAQRALAQAYLGRALVKYFREEDVAATDALESAVALDPSLYEAYLYYADINRARDPAKALAKAQLAAQYNPDFVDAYEVIGALGHKLGKRKVFEDALKKLADLAPNSEAYKNLQKLR